MTRSQDMSRVSSVQGTGILNQTGTVLGIVRRDLIHRRVRNEFRELCSGWGTIRVIQTAFEVEGFDPVPEEQRSYGDGQRRGTFDEYADGIDWSDPEQVARAIHVFEEILSWGSDVGADYRQKAVDRVRRLLERDGYTLSDDGRIRHQVTKPLTELPLEELRDPSAIEEHLRRLEVTRDSDPPLAIGSAKALVEATCKHVLEELDEAYGEKDDVPALVRAVQKALKVHPQVIAPTAKGRKTIVRTLSNLSQLVTGLAELRNEYGPDHGRTRSSGGLRPRHAHLAVGSAQTYCRFLLETLRDRRATSQ